jgi:hypothetical protein
MGKRNAEAQAAQRRQSSAVYVVEVAGGGFRAVVWPAMASWSFVYPDREGARRAGSHMAEARHCPLIDRAPAGYVAEGAHANQANEFRPAGIPPLGEDPQRQAIPS